MKKLILSLILCLFLVSLVSAECDKDLYTFGCSKQGDCITWRQGYSNSTYTNFTSVTYPNQSKGFFSPELGATFHNGEYEYVTCNYSNQLGEYEVCSRTDVDGIDTLVCNNYLVTPSGNQGNSNIVFFILVIVALYAITFIGFFGKNIPITVLGGMSMLGLGLYTINNGIIIYRDWLTNYFSYITLAIGAILALWAIIEWIEETVG